ncbi:MAG: HPr family phosphocarrier protein [Victivallaceae bacterium]|nr:HPr family phosphocarrier protein [Victivallaceae bacterium]
MRRCKKTAAIQTEIQREIKIKNALGLHARPASLFVKLASSFKSEIIVEKDGEEVNGKSLMGLLMLAAASGSVIKISAKGEDCAVALEAIMELIEKKFEEE